MFNEKSIHKKVSVLKSVEALKEKEKYKQTNAFKFKNRFIFRHTAKNKYIFFQHVSYGTVTYTLSFSL